MMLNGVADSVESQALCRSSATPHTI